MGYKEDTVYEARVETGDKIYFKFSHGEKANFVDIMRSDISNGSWLNYLLVPDIDLHYFVPNGTWILHTSVECNPTWLFTVNTKVKKGLAYTPTITRVKDGAKVSNVVFEDSLGRRHYDALIIDDMSMGSASTPKEDVSKTISWYKSMKEVRESMGSKALFHVMFFNRKTEKIDFKDYVPAVSETDACMLAAQSFGKYDSNIHVRVVKHIVEYNIIERSTAIE